MTDDQKMQIAKEAINKTFEQFQKTAEDAETVQAKLIDTFEDFASQFPDPVVKSCEVLIPGIGDIFVRKVRRLGHKDLFPRHYDWENLVPQLNVGEELLWIVKKAGVSGRKQSSENSFDFEVYIGLKFNDELCSTEESWRNRAKRFETLTRHFAKSAFPESLLAKTSDEHKVAEFLNNTIQLRHVRVLSGMPSLKNSELKEVAVKRDDNVRPYAGLNDIVEMHGEPEDDFVLVFSVAKAPEQDIRRNFGALFHIQNKIKPLIETAMTFSEGQNWGFTESKQETNSDTTTDTMPGGEKKIVKMRGLAPRAWRAAQNIWRYIAGSDGAEELDNQKLEIQKGTAKSHTKAEMEGTTSSKGGDSHRSWQVKEFNSALSFASSQIEASLQQLTQTIGTGGYYANAAVYSNDRFVAESVANAVKATLSGGQSSLMAMKVVAFSHDGHKNWLAQNKSLATAMIEEGLRPAVMNCEKACLFLPLPSTHLLGLQLKRNVFYGKERPIGRKGNCQRTQIGQMSYARSHIVEEGVESDGLPVRISDSDFYSHFFVVGTTGCGKTTRAAQIIREAKGFRRVIFETAKKTYWNELELQPKDVLVYTLGDSAHRPLRINPFYFEPGSSLKQHIAVLADAIADLLPMEALIGPKLREAIEQCYQVCGWDIESGERDDSASQLTYPNMALFNAIVNDVAAKMSDYSAEVQGNYKGALLNRAAIFLDDVYQDIFSFDGNKNVDELFPPDKTVIVEMEEMPPSEINMPAFVVSILLHRLRAYRSRIQNAANDLKTEDKGFLIVIEEAHNVLSRKFQEKGDQSQAGTGGHLVNQVSRLLAEGRGMKLGLMIIDQSAASIAPSVITNTNSKLVFRQEDGTEIETVGKAIGLKREEWNDLQLLETGEYIVRNSEFLHPVKMSPLSDDERTEHDKFKANAARADYLKKAVFCPGYQSMIKMLEVISAQSCANAKGKRAKKTNYNGLYDTFMEALLECANGNEELAMYVLAKFLIVHHLYDAVKEIYGVDREVL